MITGKRSSVNVTLVVLAAMCPFLAACRNVTAKSEAADASTDVDADSDGDTDADSDSDTSCDEGADGGTDSGIGWAGDCHCAGDCPGGDCVRIPDEEGGWWTCVVPIPEATGPSGYPDYDACTTSDDCGDGCGCWAVVDSVFVGLHNECFCDECQTDGDCSDPEAMECVPAGAFGEMVNTCVQVACEVNSDCTAEPFGVCAPFVPPSICDTDNIPSLSTRACHYPSDPCVPGVPCPDDKICAPRMDGAGFYCEDPGGCDE